MPDLFPELLAGERAAAPRTLVDVLDATVASYADEIAVDSGVDTITYAELREQAGEVAERLAGIGVGPGSKVGIRITSGTTDLYVGIVGVLLAGAAYVPVDADDPDERARVVFGEAGCAAVVGNDLVVAPRPGVDGSEAPGRRPTPPDDAWVIFTSGSTGTPKGVAVSHRSAAAFVDAEARLFCRDRPIGPGDRVMAGLSVAFDASCEEMWLAWAHGGCLVPAPRSLVRSGVDVGPWLVANAVTVVSTVPTLASLWPEESLRKVRLLILGGEACPAELAVRLQAPGREVWNTYGPTEATVVACAARLDGSDPVRIGLPLAGWDLAVVDGEGRPVGVGESGELIIGGVGLARYLDADKDAAAYAPMPTLGWDRAYRSGDVVRNDPDGLVFAGRADDQIKLGGRRIELGELDEQLLRLPGISGGAAAVRSSNAGNRLLVGYVALDPDAEPAYDAATARELLRQRLPAALVPRLAVVDTLPTRTSGKVDRDALPWPLPRQADRPAAGLSGTQGWIAEIWRDVLGAEVTGPSDDFFDFGGSSLTAAQVVGRLRERHPDVVVGDVYAHPTLAALAAAVERSGGTLVESDRKVPPIPRKTQAGQLLALVPLRALGSLRWIAWLLLGGTMLHPAARWLPTAPAWVLILTTAVLILPPGRMLLAATLVRGVLAGVRPGDYPRGGKVHLRIWLAERIQDELAAASLSGTAWFPFYARLLGADVGRGVDLHTLPPVTGMLRVGRDAAIEPEVDISGYWIDGDVVHVGEVRVRARARIGTRSMLGPGADVGKEAEIAPGSVVLGEVPAEEFWSGAPASHQARARGPWSTQAPPSETLWLGTYAALGVLIAAMPALAAVTGGLVLWPAVHDATSYADALKAGLPWLPLAGVVAFGTLAALVLGLVRLLSLRVRRGHHPVRSAAGVAIWGTVRALDEARTWLFPLYASWLTPLWLRLLGAKLGRDVEASTVLMIPSLTRVNDHAFLADDTLIGGYELGGGWIRVENVKVGKRAFVGNSGAVAPGRKLPRESLVAVLSAAPSRAEKARPGGSWMGSPPQRLRRAAGDADESRTYAPPLRLKVLRGIVETGRLLPTLLGLSWYVGVGATLLALLRLHWLLAVVLGGPVLIAAGLLAAVVTVVAKWLLVGRHRVSEHPLWSGFVWRNELADTFTEYLAAPWFATIAQGTVALNVWFRMLGARIGKGVWCDSYWLPETDLVELADGATVNQGCVVQTHLFHDRVLACDRVVLRAGATLGPHGVILPAATLGRHTTIGPVSLVMRGESVPSRTRWIGNPIGPWEEPS